jgi:RNA polymerase sigma-70 factor, ECF subfamily
MQHSTDAELVRAACGGDVESFGELYRRHYAAAVGIAYCVLADRHLAEDAAQEAFAVACRDLGRLRSGERFPSWLGAICRRTARGLAKTRFRHGLPEDVASPVEINSQAERALLVRQSVGQLPARAREVIVLHYFSGLSHEKIAAILNVSRQTVHGRLIRARRKIATILGHAEFIRSQP